MIAVQHTIPAQKATTLHQYNGVATTLPTLEVKRCCELVQDLEEGVIRLTRQFSNGLLRYAAVYVQCMYSAACSGKPHLGSQKMP